jgi:sugar lactone lactonase YvrE
MYSISNGLDWSPDGRTFYLTDTMRRAIYAHDFDLGAGTLRNRRTSLRAAEEDGYPDGLIVDRDGVLWSAGFGGSVICRYDAQGRRLERLIMPVSCPTSLTFGGRDYSTAFITTSKHVLPVGHTEADAGVLLTLASQAAGRPPAVFGGEQ